jgi:urease accessory protein
MSSDPATNTECGAARDAGGPANPAFDARWICQLLQAGDSFYPTGSYAHSYGLEGLIQQGVVKDRATLRQFLLLSILPSLERVELPMVAHAWQGFAERDWRLISELSELSSALKSAAELRAASEKIGRQRAELVATLHPTSVAPEYLRRAASGGWPFAAVISAALEAQVFGAPLDAAFSAYAYATLASLVAAAMKLLRLGQNAAQTLLAEMIALTPALMTAARDVSVDEIGWVNPWLDIAAARHESADARVFIS